jgi:hypothetical protein
MIRLQVMTKVYMACEAFATVCKAILQHIHDPIKPYWWRTTGNLYEMALHLFFMQANIILPRILENRKQFDEAVKAVMRVRGVNEFKDLYQGPDGLATCIWHQFQVDHHVQSYHSILKELLVRSLKGNFMTDSSFPRMVYQVTVPKFRSYLDAKVIDFGLVFAYTAAESTFFFNFFDDR